MAALTGSAQSFSTGGLTYTVSGSEASVTGFVAGSVPARLTVPAVVKDGGASYKVTSIGAGALETCADIKVLVLSKNIIEIGANAFMGSDMDSVICRTAQTPDMPKQAFSANTLANAILKYYANQVWQFTGLPEWKKFAHKETMPDPPMEIDGLYFEDNTHAYKAVTLVGYDPDAIAADLVIPETVVDPSKPFYDLSVVEVADNALKGAPVKSVVFPDNCEDIGANVLSGCTMLDSVVISNGVSRIGANFTEGCTNLKAVVLNPGGFIDMGNAKTAALATGAYTLYYGRTVNYSGTPAESPFAGDAVKRVVYNFGSYGNPTKGIFAASTSLETVTFAEKVTWVGAGAFSGCPALKNVVFTNEIAKIQEQAFANCASLKALHLPVSITDIAAGAFAGTPLDSVICLSSTPATLADDAFSDETFAGAALMVPAGSLDAYKSAEGWKKFVNIKEEAGEQDASFTVGGLTYTVLSRTDKTVTVSGYDAATIPATLEMPSTVTFEDQEYTVTETVQKALSNAPVKYVKLPTTVQLIAQEFLMGSKSLETVVIPAGVTRIAPRFTLECSALTKVVLEPGTETIDMGDLNDQPFSGGAFTVYVGRPIKMVESNGWLFSPFTNSRYVKRAVISPETGACAHLFANSSSLESIEFTEGCTAVGQQMASSCRALTSVKFAPTKTEIGERAFAYCEKLTSITLPASMASIGENAFSEIDMETVVSMAKLPPNLATSAFSDNTYANASLIVPIGMDDYYVQSEGWQKFAHITGRDMSSAAAIESDIDEGVVTVMDINGRVIYNGPREAMPTLRGGIYILKSGEKVQKIMGL